MNSGDKKMQLRIRHKIADTAWPSAQQATQARMYQPISLGKDLNLEQRTWIPAMVPWRATSTGEVTEELLEWYGRFAEGQPGAIVVEATGIRDIPSGPLLRIGHDRYITGLTELVRTVRERSQGKTRLLIQIIDFLAVKRRPQAAKYFDQYLVLTNAHRHRLCELDGHDEWLEVDEESVRARCSDLSPEQWPKILSNRELEALQFGYRERVTDTHLPHIRNLPQRLPKLFADAAVRAEKAGFDGVELHFAHAYTMASFLSARNDREDGYGGPKESRVRLPLEVFAATRAALSTKTVLGCRFLNDEVIADGSDVADAVYFGVEFAKAGMDYLSLSRGGKFEDAKQPRIKQAVYPYTGPSGHECMPTVYSDEAGPFGRQLPLTRQIREAIRKAGYRTPVVAAGGINSFELAEYALSSGAADIVASARQSLADPDWFKKMKLGRGDEIRRCKLTNYCEGLDQSHKQVTCQLWDRENREEQAGLKSHDTKRWLVAPKWIV